MSLHATNLVHNCGNFFLPRETCVDEKSQQTRERREGLATRTNLGRETEEAKVRTINTIMDRESVQIGQFILGKNLGIGAFGKVRNSPASSR